MMLKSSRFNGEGKPLAFLRAAGIAVVSLLLFAVFISSGAAVEIPADTAWYSPQETTYMITTPEQLAGLSLIVNGEADGIAADSFAGKTIFLGADIVLNSAEKVKENANTLKVWKPIGSYAPFKGTFDGQGHTITGLYSQVNGIFYYGEGCTIKDVTITDSSVITPNYLVGMVIGFAGDDCTITNCHVKNSVIESNSKSTGDVGGIAGEVIRGTITGCIVSDTNVICRNCDYVGGIVGYIDDVTTFTNCKVKNVIVLSAKSGVGGIAGYAFTDVSFTGCSVESVYVQTIYDNYAGGLLGFGGAEVVLNDCTVSNSVVKGYKHSVGGVVGYVYHATFTENPTAVKDTLVVAEAEEYVGGFVGSANKPVTVDVEGCAVSNVAVFGNIESLTENMGVIVGRGKMDNSSKEVTVEKTIISNKGLPSQKTKSSFSLAGTSADADGWIVSLNTSETVNGVRYGTTEKVFDVPSLESDLTSKSTTTPFPILAILAGLGVAVFLGRRN